MTRRSAQKPEPRQIEQQNRLAASGEGVATPAGGLIGKASPEPPRMTVCFVEGWEQIAARAAEIDGLAARAIERSPSAEPWMLVPALRYLRDDATIKVALVYMAESDEPHRSKTLCAVFPLQIRSRYRALPVTTYSLWNHTYSLLPAPLLHADHALQCIRCFFDWIAEHEVPTTLLEFPELRIDSAFFRVLNDAMRLDRREYFVTDMQTRAFYRPWHDAEQYLNAIGTSHRRSKMRRQEKLLSELGHLEHDMWTAVTDHRPWIQEFVALEMQGWKGREGTAFGCNSDQRAYLDAVAAAAAERGNLMMVALRLDGKPIAMRLNFVVAPGSYAFKTAFDETYARYSPGTLLELENIRRLQARPEVRWMDSLALPDSPLINKLWHERMVVVTILAAPRRFLAEAILNLIPLLRLARRLTFGGRS